MLKYKPGIDCQKCQFLSFKNSVERKIITVEGKDIFKSKSVRWHRDIGTFPVTLERIYWPEEAQPLICLRNYLL